MSEFFKERRVDRYLVIALILGAVLLFKNLGNAYFWEDEAVTALLSRSILHFGYPTGFDGVNRLVPLVGLDSPYWINEPWLPFYVVAFFFWLFGETSFVGRLPFVLFGLGSILLTYVFACRLYSDKRVARLAILLLVFSVPYLLLMRTCRYYAPTLFFSLASMIAFLKFLNKGRFSSLLLALSTVLLYFTNNGLWIPLILTQILYLVLFHRDRKLLLRYGIILLVNLAGAIPWYWIAQTFGHGAHPTWEHSRKNFEFYIRVINKYLIPFGFWIGFFILCNISARLKKSERAVYFLKCVKEALGSPSAILLFIWIAMTIGFLVFVEQRFFRYLSSVFSALFILHAVLFACLLESNFKRLVRVVLPLVLLTNLLSSPHRARSYLADYLYEITHDYDGPNEGIVRYLKQHAKPTDTVKLYYEDAPVMFYTGLKVDNRWYTAEETYPEWIIPRRPWAEEGFWATDYYKKIQEHYELIEIPYPDIQWENREDLGEHKFKTVRDTPSVMIYRRKRG